MTGEMWRSTTYSSNMDLRGDQATPRGAKAFRNKFLVQKLHTTWKRMCIVVFGQRRGVYMRVRIHSMVFDF